MKGKTPAVLMAFGAAPKGVVEQDDDMGPGAMAGEALAEALGLKIKPGMGQAVFDAFETMYKECQPRKESPEGDTESMDEEEYAE